MAFTELADPIDTGLRRGSTLPPLPLGQLRAHVVPQAGDQRLPPRPLISRQHTGQVIGERGRRTPRERVDPVRGTQFEHALQLLRAEELRRRRSQ
ncbi:hypothetical protein FXN61_48265, partial [Lentzea sp. PSKA42]